jgi:hypothetical protein
MFQKYAHLETVRVKKACFNLLERICIINKQSTPMAEDYINHFAV